MSTTDIYHDTFSKIFGFFKYTGILIGIIFVLWLLIVGSQKVYAMIDKTSFSTVYQLERNPDDFTENERGLVLVDAIVNQMRWEMNSTFGWSANDILFNSYVLDNRAYRQFGVYNATKTLVDNFSLIIARLGNNDREDPNLFRARQNYFSISPESWGYWPMVSSERYYKSGLNEIDQYKKNLNTGKATYNCKTDDIYESLRLVNSDRLLGYALGLLEDSDKLPFYTLDNRIYEAQGTVIVVRDFLNTLYLLYPQIKKNNEQNFAQAMYYLNTVCEYDPMWISTVPFNNGTLIRSHILNAKNRIDDIINSLRI